ncbi:hypothetical protein AWL63_18845 [Sphingomonas panacis]|uniref:GTP cyclohydrolase II n=1 Tax=Sphingomonas panacis TaxID=1560345 RepID=A0A1B3ZE39_9SPHN|nr:GTP cyclohydrolase II [Sphingomonas panacis]AOH85690.1 hypothetical protein AWL63_18845 [Sphingomonas panacis]
MLTRAASAKLPVTVEGEIYSFDVTGYVHNSDEILAIAYGQWKAPPALVRVHSACLTGDALGSARCDCQAQLHGAFEAIVDRGAGILIYMCDHEGRGIGLMNKLRAYSLQDGGADTVDANTSLGLPIDSRDFTGAAKVLDDLGVNVIELMTNNPDKVEALTALGVTVIRRVPILAEVHTHNTNYLSAKRARLRHLL